MHQILSFWKRILLQQPEVLNSEFTHGGWGNIRKNSEKLENRILCKQKTTKIGSILVEGSTSLGLFVTTLKLKENYLRGTHTELIYRETFLSIPSMQIYVQSLLSLLWRIN